MEPHKRGWVGLDKRILKRFKQDDVASYCQTCAEMEDVYLPNITHTLIPRMTVHNQDETRNSNYTTQETCRMLPATMVGGPASCELVRNEIIPPSPPPPPHTHTPSSH